MDDTKDVEDGPKPSPKGGSGRLLIDIATLVAAAGAVAISAISMNLTNDATKESNKLSEELAKLQALGFVEQSASSTPSLMVYAGNSAPDYIKGSAWNPSRYTVVITGAELTYSYGNIPDEDEVELLGAGEAEGCELVLWATDDEEAESQTYSCEESFAVQPGEVLWILASITDDQKAWFCDRYPDDRYPDGLISLTVKLQQALFNVSSGTFDTLGTSGWVCPASK